MNQNRKNNPEDSDSNVENHCDKNCSCNKGHKKNDWFAIFIFAALVGTIAFLALYFWK